MIAYRILKLLSEAADNPSDLSQVNDNTTFDNYPQAGSKNAQKALDFKDKHGDEVTAMTDTGWARANQLADREVISFDTVKRIAQFNRHRKNSKISDKHKDEPWKDNGYVSWLGWGGDEMVDWAMELVDKVEKAKNES